MPRPLASFQQLVQTTVRPCMSRENRLEGTISESLQEDCTRPLT
jgi:hypothetical protein